MAIWSPRVGPTVMNTWRATSGGGPSAAGAGDFTLSSFLPSLLLAAASALSFASALFSASLAASSLGLFGSGAFSSPRLTTTNTVSP